MLKEIKKVLYRLKLDWGVSIIYVKTGETITDLETGLKLTDSQFVKIKKAILLPINILRKFVTDESVSRLNTSGLYEYGDRVILIDGKDLYSFNLNDYIIYDNKKYSIKEIVSLVEIKATMLIIREIEGGYINNIISKSISDNFIFSQDI